MCNEELAVEATLNSYDLIFFSRLPQSQISVNILI